MVRVLVGIVRNTPIGAGQVVLAARVLRIPLNTNFMNFTSTQLSRLIRFYCLLVFLFLLTLLTACNRSTPTPATVVPPLTFTPTGEVLSTPMPPPTATATPSSTPTITPTVTPTPTITPTPTSTPNPPAQLETADRLLHNGDYSAAARVYQTFLDQFPEHELAGDAAFGLGKALWFDSQYDQAANTFAALTANTAYIADHPEAFYWLGRAYAQVNNATEAATAFETYAQRRPVLAAQAYDTAGRAYLKDQDPANAIRLFAQALAVSPDQTSTLRAREGLAQANLDAGDPAAAIAQYQAILEQARNPGYRPEMLYLLGQAQLAQGQNEEAYANFQKAITTAPTTTFAYQALVALVEAAQPVDSQLRGQIDLEAGAYQPAIAALYEYIEAAPDHDGSAHALIAHAYEGLGDYANADVSGVKSSTRTLAIQLKERRG